jgi:hypothetical protein
MNKETTDVAVEAARLMIRAAVQTIGTDIDDDTRNLTMAMTLGIVLASFKLVDESIPRIAATAYLRNNEHP